MVLVAAGAGTRLGATVPKALVPLGERPLVAHAVARICATGLVQALVVTAPPGYGQQIRAAASSAIGSAPGQPPDLQVVEGEYPSRQASVAAGLHRLTAEVGTILVHDAARPLAPSSMIARLIGAVREGFPAVVPGLPVTDTIRMVHEQERTRAQALLDRDRLRAMQTPQAFAAEVLRRAHDSAAALGRHEYSAATDDAALVEALGIEVQVLPGERAAMKVTDAHDLAVARMYLDQGW